MRSSAPLAAPSISPPASRLARLRGSLPASVRGPLLGAIAIALACAPRPARAAGQELPCGRVDPDVIHIDGLLEDWQDVQPLILGSGKDFSVQIKCNYDDQFLYLLADVQDDKLSRSGGGKSHAAPSAAKPGKPAKPARAAHAKAPPKGKLPKGVKGGRPFPHEDGVEFVFEEAGRLVRLVVLPGNSDKDIAHTVYFDPPRDLKYEEADALQAAGWAVEVKLPLRGVPGWFAGSPTLRLAVAAHDVDAGGAASVLATSPLKPGALSVIPFGEASQQLEGFLNDRHLSPKDIRFDTVGRGTGHVVLAGRLLAFVSQEWAYVELPVSSAADVLDIRLADLAGDGRDAALLRYRELVAGGATREVLAAYRVTADGLSRIFGVEVGRAQGGNRLTCKVSYLRRNTATDIVVEPQPAVGWSSANYREPTSEDIVPIPLPWDPDNKKVRFTFKGDMYLRAD